MFQTTIKQPIKILIAVFTAQNYSTDMLKVYHRGNEKVEEGRLTSGKGMDKQWLRSCGEIALADVKKQSSYRAAEMSAC